VRNALTFDVEEYFHAEAFARAVRPDDWPSLESRVAASMERVLELLNRSKARATFFVLGWVAERQRGLVREIHAQGHELACHGHAHRMIGQLSRDEFRRDVERAKCTLEDAVGSAITGYRAPTFSVMADTLWSLDVLCELGFQYDSSIFPIVHDRYGLPGAPRFPHRVRTPGGGELAEFPPSTVELLGRRLPVAGGGYFRLLPWKVTRWAIHRLNEREGQPAMIYLHPWEMDPGQPELPAGAMARLRHRLNLPKTDERLRALLDEFEVGPVADILLKQGLIRGGGAR
jgi:polysaccharide deacetylase family protein (PEP-CTERM system associated)